VETIYMPGFRPDQINDVTKVLHDVLEIDKVSVESARGYVTIRAPQEMLKIANYELADLMEGNSEIVLDMKVYAIDKTRGSNIGLGLTQSVTAFNFYSQATQIISQYQTQITAAIANGTLPATATPLQIVEALFAAGLLNSNPLLTNGILGTVGGGLTYTGVSATSLPSLNLGLNKSDARSLDEVQLRVQDHQTATFRVGTRYPIVTSSYSSGGVSSSLVSQATPAQLAALGLTAATAAAAAQSVTIPQVQYEDLGLTLKAIPTVLRNGSISLAIDLKIEALGGSSLDGNPILASRALVSNVTIGEGQTAELVSSLSKQESLAVSGLPGLSEIPGFQDTADNNGEVDTSELVISLTPRIVRRGHSAMASQPLTYPHVAPEQSNHDE
jgi:type II secretory pathway component GspD/PulD (secretin)